MRTSLKTFFIEHFSADVVATAADGDEAFEAYKQHKPDLMTLDLIMPNKTGLEIIDEIFAIDKEMKIIVISSIQDPQMINDLYKKGVKLILMKPLMLVDPNVADNIQRQIEKIL